MFFKKNIGQRQTIKIETVFDYAKVKPLTKYMNKVKTKIKLVGKFNILISLLLVRHGAKTICPLWERQFFNKLPNDLRLNYTNLILQENSKNWWLRTKCVYSIKEFS